MDLHHHPVLFCRYHVVPHWLHLHESGADQSVVFVLKRLREIEMVDCDMRLYACNTCEESR
jgi:hypothetical protein